MESKDFDCLILPLAGAAVVFFSGFWIYDSITEKKDREASEKANAELVVKQKAEEERVQAEARKAEEELKQTTVKEVACIKAVISNEVDQAEYYVPAALIKYAQHEERLDAKKIVEKSGVGANNFKIICVLEPVDNTKNSPMVFKDNPLDVLKLKRFLDSCPSQDLSDIIMRKIGNGAAHAVGSFLEGAFSKGKVSVQIR